MSFIFSDHYIQNVRRESVRRLKGWYWVATGKLNPDQRGGLTLGLRLLVKKKKALVGIISTGILAGLFESGTIGILGFAVAILIGEQDVHVGAKQLGNLPYLSEYVSTISRAGVFLILVVFAVVSHVIKSRLIYINEVLGIKVNTWLSLEVE